MDGDGKRVRGDLLRRRLSPSAIDAVRFVGKDGENVEVNDVCSYDVNSETKGDFTPA